MLRPEVEAIVSQNNRDLIPVFRQWMNLAHVMSLEPESRWEEIRKNRLLPDEVKDHIDSLLEQSISLTDEEIVIFVDREISKVPSWVSGDHLPLVRSWLYRWRGTAQAIFAEESGLFPDLDRPDPDQSRVYISAGADGLRADVERGVIIPETEKTAEAFGFAGMPKIQYVIWKRVNYGVIDNELWVHQVPRTDYIAAAERRLFEWVGFDLSGLRIF